MNYYDAKFARLTKDKPTNWLIVPINNNKFKLIYLGE